MKPIYICDLSQRANKVKLAARFTFTVLAISTVAMIIATVSYLI